MNAETPTYAEQLESCTALTTNLHFTLSHLNRTADLFPRKHRLNPDDPEHPSVFAEGSYKLLAAAGEMIIAALEINQRAIPIPEGHECLPYFSEPVRQAAEEAMERVTRRRLDKERYALDGSSRNSPTHGRR